MSDNITKGDEMRMDYGDKRDYPKIDIYYMGQYQASTTWAKTCKEAIESWKAKNGIPASNNVTARKA